MNPVRIIILLWWTAFAASIVLSSFFPPFADSGLPAMLGLAAFVVLILVSDILQFTRKRQPAEE